MMRFHQNKIKPKYKIIQLLHNSTPVTIIIIIII